MDSSDPYRSTNPWTLARYLKNTCRYCPVCRKPCTVNVAVDPREELISMVADCNQCGKTTLVPYLEEDMDLSIRIDGSDCLYEPDDECHRKVAILGGTDTDGADRQKLRGLTEIAGIYAATRRASRSADLGRKVSEEYRKNIGREGWEGCREDCLAQCLETAEVLENSDRKQDALGLFDEYLPLTKGDASGISFAFRLARAFSVFATGDAKEPTAEIREIVETLDKMKSGEGLPSDDPLIRSRAYEALGTLLSAKNDKQGAMKAMRKASEESLSVVSSCPSEDGLRWNNRCAREYAFACYQADNVKRSTEALKNAVKLSSDNRTAFPRAYAESLLERAMFLTSSNSEIPAYLRKDMDEAISILEAPDTLGRHDPMLPLAYYYRSMTGPDKDKLDGSDLAMAYAVIRDGVLTGDVPEEVLTSVMDTYATYLDVYDEEKSLQVRKELALMGIFIRPPLKKKKDENLKTV